MKIEIKVPPTGEAIAGFTIGTWYKKEGAVVGKGEKLLKLGTDETNMELSADQGGRLQITAVKGDAVVIGQTIGYIDTAPEATDSNGAEENKSAQNDQDSGTRPQLKQVQTPPQAEVVEMHPQETTKQVEERVVPMSMMRRRLASQLVETQQTAAILSTFNEVDMSAIIALRTKYQDSFIKKHGVKLGLMSFFIKASVEALKATPEVNAAIDGTNIIYRSYSDIGVAMASEKGLVVPIIRAAEEMSFAQIEKNMVDYARRAQEGKITLSELEGGTFTISNGGSYGSLLSTPILNPPQSGILGMHKIEKRPVVVNDQVVIRPMMYLALSYDHRVVDGKSAVTFLVQVKQSLEDPARLLLEI